MKDKTEEHDAFGTITITRCVGANRLVGSMVDRTPASVHVVVRRARRCVDDGTHTEYYAGHGAPIVDLLMTPHQFAEAITGFGEGSETPVTLRAVGGKSCPEPTAETPMARIVASASARATEAIVDGELGLAAAISDLTKAIENAKMGKGARAKLLARARNLMDHVRAPKAAGVWASERIAETAADAVSQAKTEIAAALGSIAMGLGLRQMRGGLLDMKALECEERENR